MPPLCIVELRPLTQARRFVPFLSCQSIFAGLEERHGKELKAVRSQYPSEPVRVTEEPLIVHWEDGIQMLRDAGHEVRFTSLLAGLSISSLFPDLQ